jgi:caffeoyl-CoA O-methyltransferase
MRRMSLILSLLSVMILVSAVHAQRPARRGTRPPQGTARENPAPQGKDDTETKILEILKDMYENQRRGMMNVPTDDGRLLRMLVEMSGAKQVVEIGTSNGYSGLWMCLGLRKTGGKLTTYEIDAGRAKLARENIERAGMSELIELVEGDAHKEILKLKGGIDIVFLDADKEGYVDYLDKLLPLLRPGGLIIAHNVRSHGNSMQPFLDAVSSKPELETLFLHMHAAGVGVTMKKR